MRTGGCCFSIVRICIGEVCVRSKVARSARTVDVKRVHVVARGMMLGNVERLEIVVRRLHLRPGHHGEAERKKNALNSSKVCRNRCREPSGALDAGKRKIDLVACGSGLFGRSFDFAAALLQR